LGLAYAPSATALEPLSAEETAAWQAVRADPPPKQLTRNSHYVISDEKRHDLYRQAIEHSGGVFVGVGTNQNYEMIGWARSEVAVLLDFDQMVVDLHAVYRVAFLVIADPAEFIRFWHKDSYNKSEYLIRDMITEPEAQKAALKAYRYSRKLVHGKLRRTVRRDKKHSIQSFVSDQDQYDVIRDRFKAGRVFAVRGDLTAQWTMRDLAKVMRQFNRPLRVLYISNCEQYFSFSDDYRENIRVQPTDGRSLILRTRPWRRRHKENREMFGPIQYTFMAQSFPAMRMWMAKPKVKKLYDMILRHRDPKNMVHLDRLPKSAKP